MNIITRVLALILPFVVFCELSAENPRDRLRMVPKKQAACPKGPGKMGIEVSIKNRKWSEVFEWLSNESGIPFVGSPPAGSFTFIGPNGVKFTIPEIVTIINQKLREQHGFTLIRRPRSFILVPVEGANVGFPARQ